MNITLNSDELTLGHIELVEEMTGKTLAAWHAALTTGVFDIVDMLAAIVVARLVEQNITFEGETAQDLESSEVVRNEVAAARGIRLDDLTVDLDG